MSVKNKVLMSSAIILVIVFVVGSNYYFSKVKPYNQLLNNANQAMTKEDYEKAVTLYGEALSYKDDLGVYKKVDFAKNLKKSKETYAIAVKQMAGKDYITAIDSFTKVDKQDTKRYSNSQSSIIECKKLYITDNLKNAQDNIERKKFDEANKYIGNILKFDAKNEDAFKLKADIDTALQKQKEDDQLAAKVIASKQTQKLTSQQALNLVKSKIRLKTYEYYAFQEVYIYNGDECYVIKKSYVDPEYPEAEVDICVYLVNMNTGAITKSEQDIYTPIN